jgi:hypothetical protein
MKRALAAICLGSVLGTVAQGQPSPFARPPAAASPDGSQMSLGNVMLLIQIRHAKIWYAGQAEDWDLVTYELSHLASDLTAAAILYRDIPLELVTNAGRNLGRMRDAAARKDASGFQAGFTDLTASCNACHTAGGVAFIRIQAPTGASSTNQLFQSSAR